MKKLADAGPIIGSIFGLAVKGKQTLPWPFGAVIDKVLLAKVKQATGGRLRLAVCGGGNLSKETQKFLGTVLAPMMQGESAIMKGLIAGYGLTETCGMATITTPDFWLPGSVGTLGPSCEMKLAGESARCAVSGVMLTIDQPELGYISTAKPPQGEIWLRGPNVFKGYFKRPELDAEAFTEDGWFKTGDIGQVRAMRGAPLYPG